jgi:CDP-glucose 4,6-dehydratase
MPSTSAVGGVGGGWGGGGVAICVKIPAAVGIDFDFWRGRRVLVTGHTGFKGAWLSLWLQSLGAELTGIAAGTPSSPSLYELTAVGSNMREHSLDVRDASAIREALRGTDPEVVLHLAAQPIVRRAFEDPLMTYEVNVMGTANVLEALRLSPGSTRAVVVVTSDKAYENPGVAGRRLLEGDRLGGADPYSSSKACAELLTDAYRRSFFTGEDSPRVATARAGNVIGGGDWGQDRLIPDIVRAVQAGVALRVRNPEAVRPWQHVLNPLSGYLLLVEHLWRSRDAARAWNFGPRAEDSRTVSWIVQRAAALWEGAFSWEQDERPHPPEAAHLALDSSAAENDLGWRPAWDLEQALERIVEWHRAHRREEDLRALSLAQIERFAGP